MRKTLLPLILVLSALALTAGCSKSGISHAIDFKHTGCAGTRAGYLTDDEPSALILKYENGNLRVTRLNAFLNCSIKDRGLTCSACFKGNAIQYEVDYAKDGQDVRCTCQVIQITSLVTDLEEGKEYTLDYWEIGQKLGHFSFTFTQDLYAVLSI